MDLAHPSLSQDYNSQIGKQSLDGLDTELVRMQGEVMQKMSEAGLIEVMRSAEDTSPRFVILKDLEYFKGTSEKKYGEAASLDEYLQKYASEIYTNPQYGASNALKTLFFVFKDMPVITKDDYDRYTSSQTTDPMPSRKLFNTPSEGKLNPLPITEKQEYYLSL